MFNSQNVGERGSSRPIVVGFVLLLIFLSLSQDWGSPPTRNNSRRQLKDPTHVDVTEQTKEKIIEHLVKSNEDLEDENQKLRLDLSKLRTELRTMRSMNNSTKTNDTTVSENSPKNVTGNNSHKQEGKSEEEEKADKVSPTQT